MTRPTHNGKLAALLAISQDHPHELAHFAAHSATRPDYYFWREPNRSYTGAVEAWRLKVLNSYADGVHKRINERAALHALLQRNAVNGKVQLIESGRDCDCVEYTHSAGMIDANWAALYVKERDTGEWADGPFSFTIVRPDEQVESESRDLVMEAYEDGHPHHIVSRFA